jgi:hypothetical protein
MPDPDSLFRVADDKKPQDDNQNGVGDGNATGSGTVGRVGDPHKEKGDASGSGAFESSDQALRAAAGLEGGSQNSRYSVSEFGQNVGQGEGISRGQVVKYTDTDGRTIQGGQYSNSEGTFFKTPEGDKYKVQLENGQYNLQPTKPGQQPIEATAKDVVSDGFGRFGSRNLDNENNRNGDRGALDPTKTVPPADRTVPPPADKIVPPADKAVPPADTTVPPAVKTVPPADTKLPHVDKTAPPPATVVDKNVVPDKIVAPVVVPEKSVVATAAPITSGAADRTTTADHPAAALAAPAKTVTDPATFYNNFKAANDQTQRDMAASLASLPKDQRANFINQVVDVGKNTDRAGAPGVLNDLRDNVKAVRGSTDNPIVAPAVPAVTNDRTITTPAAVPGGGKTVTDGSQIIAPTKVPDTGAVINLANINKPGTGDGTITINRPGGDLKVVTNVDGVILAKGQIPGGDSFRPDGKDRPAPGQQLDPSILLSRGVDGKLQNPADRIALGPDGKPIQLPDAVLKGLGQRGDGKDSPGGLARGKDAGDQPQALTPAQRNMISGLDLNDPQTKAFLADALRQIQATKLGDFDPRHQNRSLQDILKGFDPNKVDKLQAFLNPDGKGPINDAAVGKLTSILTQSSERVVGTAATDLTLGQKTSIDRVTEMIRGNQNLIDLTTLQTKDARLLQEINRLVGDVNKQFGFDGKNALSLGDIIGRSLDGTKGGERGLGLEGKGPLDRALGLDPLSFTAKMPPAQEQAIRALLDAKGLTGDSRGETSRQEYAATIASRLADLTGKNEPATKLDQLGAKTEVKAELVVRPDTKEDRPETSDHLTPFSKNDMTVPNLDGTKKPTEEKESLVAKHKDEQARLEEDQKRREEALLVLAAERKLREDKEKQQKEQERLQERKKDEDARRRRYVVRENDTLESIATKQLRDAKLAPLIYELNRKELALKTENGKEVVDLRPRQVIWLPSGVDIKEFRKRLHSGSTPQSTGGGKLTAEDELAARFGNNWAGTTPDAATVNSGISEDTVHDEMMSSAVAASQVRRANIETLLGPLSKQKPTDGRIRYVVRLGDTLKSVAMKHPSLQEVSLWLLLAEVNEIAPDTDEKGIPMAKLSRGSTLLIPTPEEIQAFREKHGAKSNLRAERATKTCPQCGRLSVLGASICGACAHSFNVLNKPAVTDDAGMMVMQAAGFVGKPGATPEKRPSTPSDVTVNLEDNTVVIPERLYDESTQLAIVQLDEQTRLTRFMNHGDAPSTIVLIEVSCDNAWQSVVAYEIFPKNSMRHEYNPKGERKSVRIDLPTEAILELSNNDLKANWKNYRDRYFAQLISLNR